MNTTTTKSPVFFLYTRKPGQAGEISAFSSNAKRKAYTSLAEKTLPTVKNVTRATKPTVIGMTPEDFEMYIELSEFYIDEKLA